MIQKSLLLMGTLGLGLLAAPSHAQTSPPPPTPVYWCVYQCADGTQSGGYVSSGYDCDQLADNACLWHGGKRATGLEFGPPSAAYWCSIKCADGTEGGGSATSQADCDTLASLICSGHGTVTQHEIQPK